MQPISFDKDTAGGMKEAVLRRQQVIGGLVPDLVVDSGNPNLGGEYTGLR